MVWLYEFQDGNLESWKNDWKKWNGNEINCRIMKVEKVKKIEWNEWNEGGKQVNSLRSKDWVSYLGCFILNVE